MKPPQVDLVPKRPSVFNVLIGLTLALLIVAALRGVDLQHQLLRLVWVTIGSSNYFVELAVSEPTRLVVIAPLRIPLFGWVTCLICLAVIGSRTRYRVALPVVALCVVCLFGYLLVEPVYSILTRAVGLERMKQSYNERMWVRSVPLILCNLAAALVLWRWTRSRVMLVSMLVLGLTAALIYTLCELNPIEAFGDESEFTYSVMDIQNAIKGNDIEIVLKTETEIDPTDGYVWTYPVSQLNIKVIYCIVFNAIAFLLALWVAIFPTRRLSGECPTCNYNLAGLKPGSPCPECGEGIQPSSLTAASTSSA